MTREEATRALKTLKTECGEKAEWVLPRGWGEAIDMAINALKTENIIEKGINAQINAFNKANESYINTLKEELEKIGEKE